MNRFALPVLLLMLAVSASAQTTTYTESVVHSCQFATGSADVCNGMPLDQGGTWQFIVANETFSISRPGFYICGNPASTGCPGGLHITSDTIFFNSPGELNFTWAALDPITKQPYSGSAIVFGHYTKGCNNHGCWHTLVVDSATVTVN